MIRGRFVTGANMVSIARIPLSAAAAYMILGRDTLWTAVFMVLAAATDWVDGWLARKTSTVSDWGRILDPAADKIAFILVAAALLKTNLLPLWMLLLLVIRDGLIALGGLVLSTRLRPPSSNIWGKTASTVLTLYMIRQALFPGFQILESRAFAGTDLLGVLAALLVVVSFLTYLKVFAGTNWNKDET